MKIRTEPIGSIPRPVSLMEGMSAFATGDINEAEINKLFDPDEDSL